MRVRVLQLTERDRGDASEQSWERPAKLIDVSVIL